MIFQWAPAIAMFALIAWAIYLYKLRAAKMAASRSSGRTGLQVATDQHREIIKETLDAWGIKPRGRGDLPDAPPNGRCRCDMAGPCSKACYDAVAEAEGET